MKLFDQANTIIKEIILINEDNYLNPERIALLSREDIEFEKPSITETEEVPYSTQTRDGFGMSRNTVDFGYPYGGYLRDQTQIKADTVYMALQDNELIQVLSTVDKAWTLGTTTPDSTMRKFNIKTLAGY